MTPTCPENSTSFFPTAVCKCECAPQPVNYEPMVIVQFYKLYFYGKRHSDFLAECLHY